VVDPDKGSNGQEALTRITPGPFPEAESMDIQEYYESPWPLSEKYFGEYHTSDFMFALIGAA